MSEKQEVRRAFYRIRKLAQKPNMCWTITHRQPVVTVCLLRDSVGNTAKGYAICSKMDSFDNKKGKVIAEQRAIKALKEQSDSSPVNYWKALKNLEELPISDVFPESGLEIKCQFNPKLTDQDEKSLRTASETVLI